MSEQIPRIPAPWSLGGTGYIIGFRLPAAVLDEGSFLDPALIPGRRGRIALVMYADYQQADCGPYQELLFVPGNCRFGKRQVPTISRIFVSSQSSVENGRLNWGVPKYRCDFYLRHGADGVDEIQTSLDGKVFAKLQLRASGLRLPVTTAILPKRLRMMGQYLDGKAYTFAPSASGRIRPARLLSVWTDPAVFPDLSLGRPLFAARVEHFKMLFPVADIGTLA